jgi:hypothetical protein
MVTWECMSSISPILLSFVAAGTRRHAGCRLGIAILSMQCRLVVKLSRETVMERRQCFSADKSDTSLPIISTRRYVLSQSGGGTDSGRRKNSQEGKFLAFRTEWSWNNPTLILAGIPPCGLAVSCLVGYSHHSRN